LCAGLLRIYLELPYSHYWVLGVKGGRAFGAELVDGATVLEAVSSPLFPQPARPAMTAAKIAAFNKGDFIGFVPSGALTDAHF
jgi:hypothetical protein